jgi:hypothetical protein
MASAWLPSVLQDAAGILPMWTCSQQTRQWPCHTNGFRMASALRPGEPYDSTLDLLG